MRNKTLLILLMVALAVTLVLQNTGNVSFIFLWHSLTLAKSTIILGSLAIGFIVGVLIATSNTSNSENSGKNNDDENYLN